MDDLLLGLWRSVCPHHQLFVLILVLRVPLRFVRNKKYLENGITLKDGNDSVYGNESKRFRVTLFHHFDVLDLNLLAIQIYRLNDTNPCRVVFPLATTGMQTPLSQVVTAILAAVLAGLSDEEPFVDIVPFLLGLFSVFWTHHQDVHRSSWSTQARCCLMRSL